MSSTGNDTQASEISAPWVKSSYSGPQGNCVQIAYLTDGQVAMSNSRYPSGPALVFTSAEWDAFLRGALAGEFGKPA